jgi:hypothetical protein
MKNVFSPPCNCFLKNFCVASFILGFRRLGPNSEAYNVLTLGCLGCVEPNIIVIVPFKPLMKLRFGFNIMP